MSFKTTSCIFLLARPDINRFANSVDAVGFLLFFDLNAVGEM